MVISLQYVDGLCSCSVGAALSLYCTDTLSASLRSHYCSFCVLLRHREPEWLSYGYIGNWLQSREWTSFYSQS